MSVPSPGLPAFLWALIARNLAIMFIALALPLGGARALAAAERAALLGFFPSEKMDFPPTLRLTFFPAAFRLALLAARKALRPGSMALEGRFGFIAFFIKAGTPALSGFRNPAIKGLALALGLLDIVWSKKVTRMSLFPSRHYG